MVRDPIVTAVQVDLEARSVLGLAKYGTTLARTDLGRAEWLQHAYEEALDLALYLRRLLHETPGALAGHPAQHGRSSLNCAAGAGSPSPAATFSGEGGE